MSSNENYIEELNKKIGIYFEKKEYKKALEEIQAFPDKNNSIYLYYLALIKNKLNQKKEALEILNKLTKDQPKFLEAFHLSANINEDLKVALIAVSNLFLMPSRIEKNSVEGFGISFIEAASYGVASIGGKDGGASDAITHNKTGLICNGEDLNSIYDSVIDLFKNEKFIIYGKNAKNFSENFHWNKVVKKYLKLIN